MLRRRMLYGKDLKFNQQVLNGNFASGTTNWTTTNASDITTSNGEISFKNTSTSSASSLKQTRGSWYPNNKKYLLVLKAKLDFTSGAFYWTFCGKSVSITPIMDSAYHSYEALATSTNTSATWIDLYTRPTDGTGKLIHFKDIMIINLTQMYGAGNEPTDIDTIKADCANIGHSLDVYQEFKA